MCVSDEGKLCEAECHSQTCPSTTLLRKSQEKKHTNATAKNVNTGGKERTNKREHVIYCHLQHSQWIVPDGYVRALMNCVSRTWEGIIRKVNRDRFLQRILHIYEHVCRACMTKNKTRIGLQSRGHLRTSMLRPEFQHCHHNVGYTSPPHSTVPLHITAQPLHVLIQGYGFGYNHWAQKNAYINSFHITKMESWINNRMF